MSEVTMDEKGKKMKTTMNPNEVLPSASANFVIQDVSGDADPVELAKNKDWAALLPLTPYGSIQFIDDKNEQHVEFSDASEIDQLVKTVDQVFQLKPCSVNMAVTLNRDPFKEGEEAWQEYRGSAEANKKLAARLGKYQRNAL